jgi:predicted RNase H-like HicB family nuclease
MASATFTAIIEYDGESGMYVGCVPELPGAFTQAPSLEALHANLQEVAELVLADLAAHGEQPRPHRFVGTHELTVAL